MKGRLYTVEEFNEFVELDLDGFVTQVCLDVNNRVPTEKEMRAMATSYPVVSQMLAAAVEKNPNLSGAHVGFSMVKFEYKLPSAPAWCDLVLLGAGEERKQVVIVELKDWHPNTSDQPGMCEGLIFHKGHSQEHPADQVKGYTEYCRNFHSSVVEESAEVNGCVFFTRKIDTAPYTQVPNDQLTIEYPVYNYDKLDEMAEFVAKKIKGGDGEWATRFVNGYYQQNRNILKQVAESFEENSNARPFVLLDEQRVGYLSILHHLEEAVRDRGKKRVIIVSGPPGSGKSAIALNLWAEAVRRYCRNDGEHPGNIVFVATSSSQNDNWQNIFSRYSHVAGAGGLVMRSNNFNPGMTGGSMKKEYVPIFKEKYPMFLSSPDSLKYEFFEQYTDYMIQHGKTKGYRDNLHFLSIVDEAHALINPLAPNFSTNSLGGWCMQMGPQAYHIIRESEVSVFLMDGEQSFRDNETTQVKDILKWGMHLGAFVEQIDLSDLQFRCAGSSEYVEWAEGILSQHPLKNVSLWKDQFKVRVFDTTLEMESELRKQNDTGDCVRLLSSCSVPWISDKSLDAMHTKGDVDCDFNFVDHDGRRFKRHWNNPARMDIFVQAPPFTKMHEDPLCEVGCPYETRGFDFDYVGILWLGDVVWRKDRWKIDLNKTVDRANKCAYGQAKKEVLQHMKSQGVKVSKVKEFPLVDLDDPNLPKTTALGKTVAQAYRILMTRAVKGAYLYIQDPETREYIRSLLQA